jgi:hypothetical protein
VRAAEPWQHLEPWLLKIGQQRASAREWGALQSTRVLLKDDHKCSADVLRWMTSVGDSMEASEVAFKDQLRTRGAG